MAALDFVAALDMSLDDVISSDHKPGRWPKNSKGGDKVAEKKKSLQEAASTRSTAAVVVPSRGGKDDAVTAVITKNLTMSLDEVIAKDRSQGKGGKTSGKVAQKEASNRSKFANTAGKQPGTRQKTWDNSKDAGSSKKYSSAAGGDSWEADAKWSDNSQSYKAWNSGHKDGWNERSSDWNGGGNSGKDQWERSQAWTRPADYGQHRSAAEGGGSWTSWSQDQRGEQVHGIRWNAAESSNQHSWREPPPSHRDGGRDPRDFQRGTEQPRFDGYPPHGEYTEHRSYSDVRAVGHPRGHERIRMDSRDRDGAGGHRGAVVAGGGRGIGEGAGRSVWRHDPEASEYAWVHPSSRGVNDRQRPVHGTQRTAGQKRRYEDLIESSQAKKVKVTNLPFDLDENDITKAFEKEAGRIVDCWSENKGSIVMIFERAQDAQTAVDTYHKGELNKRTIDVELMY